MMGAFLDLLGIAHENGLISEENLAEAGRTRRCSEAATELATKYPRR